jgi:hypothetical protein
MSGGERRETRIATSTDVGAREVGLDDGSEALRILDLDLRGADRQYRPGSAAEQQATSSSVDQLEPTSLGRFPESQSLLPVREPTSASSSSLSATKKLASTAQRTSS